MALAFLTLALEGRVGLDLSDEGYLWYGARQTLAGQVPLRDFQSYEPGRYYWSAAFLLLAGDGPLGLRLALAAMQGVAVWLGLLCLTRVRTSWASLWLCGLLLSLWAVPRHKTFEPALALGGVWMVLRLLEGRTPRRHFELGLWLGLAAFFGRNHFLYQGAGAVALLLIFTRVDRSVPWRQLCALGAGLGTGLLPLLFLLLFVRGFAEAFLQTLEVNPLYPNLALPTPWPWQAQLHQADLLAVTRQLATGLVFLLLPVCYGLGTLALLARPRLAESRPLLAAALLIGAPYAHHAFARADPSHLAQSIHPLLVGLLALALGHSPPRPTRLALPLIGFLLLSALVAGPMHSFALRRLTERHVVAGDVMQVEHSTWAILATVSEIAGAQPAGARAFLAPDWPGVYAALGWTAPTWEIYYLLPATSAHQQRLIAQLDRADVTWALIDDKARDGRDGLRFRHTHPLLWAYFGENFERVAYPGLPSTRTLFRRRAALPADSR